MLTVKKNEIGKCALLLVLQGEENVVLDEVKVCTGRVGTMESKKIVAAIETAAKSTGVIDGTLYREIHSLYHATMEALQGVTRGQVMLDSVLRTVGLRFSVVRGRPFSGEGEGEWIAVALYGTIGAPIKSLEHEAVGLGVNHI